MTTKTVTTPPAPPKDDPPPADPCDDSQIEPPDIEQLIAWEAEGGCEAVDGCWTEADGHCSHGCPSWLLVLGLI